MKKLIRAGFCLVLLLIVLLVLVAFLWLGHTLLGIDISGPANYLTGRFLSAPSKHAKKNRQSE